MLQKVLYPLLRPLMRVLLYRANLRLSRLPHPVDAPHVHAAGADPDRVLIFGSGPAVGYGVLSNELALPGQLARQLSAITGRGADIDVVADTEVTIQGSLALLQNLNLWRYDAILLTIGVNNAMQLTSVGVWRTAIGELLRYVSEHVPERTRVLVVAVPPIRTIDAASRASSWIADRHAVVLNRETRRIVSLHPRMIFVPFSPLAATGEVPRSSATTYQQWASIIVAPLGLELADDPRNNELASSDEVARQAALDATGIIGTEPEERFDRIARLASQLFGTAAAITFIDHDRHWFKAQVGWNSGDIPRVGSFGDEAIRGNGAHVVEDAEQSGGARHGGVRFYAGYPIESGFGERIGVISLFTREPRGWTTAETELLRDLALQVQRELLG